MNSKDLSKKARILSLKMVSKSNSSHIGSALSIIDIVSVLYADVLDILPSDETYEERDRFILSKGHACAAVYSVLALRGFFPLEDLESYGDNGSMLMTHISHKIPGIEFSTGSLGHGLPFGVGKALAAKKRKETWKTYVLMSDGEMQAGSNWEAFMFAAHHKLDNMIAIIDYNNLQSLTTVDKTLNIQPLSEKLKSFGWHVIEVDGHNHEALKKSFKNANRLKNKPIVIIAKTKKGKGVSFMENKVEWHYRSPSAKELKIAINEIVNA